MNDQDHISSPDAEISQHPNFDNPANADNDDIPASFIPSLHQENLSIISDVESSFVSDPHETIYHDEDERLEYEMGSSVSFGSDDEADDNDFSLSSSIQ